MNFFQNTLAGLESRLDKVLLAEDEQPQTQPQPQPVTKEKKEELISGNVARRSVDIKGRRGKCADWKLIMAHTIDARSTMSPQQVSAAALSARMSMQERLAAAMARGKTPARSNSPVSSSGGGDAPSRTSTPAPRTSISSEKERRVKKPEPEPELQPEKENEVENGIEKENEEEPNQEQNLNGKATESVIEPEATEEREAPAPAEAISSVPPPTELEPEPAPTPAPENPEQEQTPLPRTSDDAPRAPIDTSKPATPVLDLHGQNGIEDINSSVTELENTISQLQEDLVLCETRRQEELHASSERIDALEEKIRYLARESAEASRCRVTSTSGGLEKKLAEREEKIALLLEEGEKLSKNELKLQNTIKKLRAKTQEEEKATAEAKRRLEKAEKEAAEAKEKAKRALENEKREKEKVKGLGKIESELETLRREKADSQGTIAELKEKLTEAVRRMEDAESRVQTEALEKEKMVTAELRAQVERIRTEAVSVEEKLKGEAQDLKAMMDRAAERARRVESELKEEQMIMESKMEALRARAEEVSSGAAGDAHAKLLRQVETLQTQYAIASENWKGIEDTLLSRVSNLEKERDDIAKKENDIRKKARELNLKSKNLESDLDAATLKIKDLKSDLSSQTTTISTLRARVSTLESTLLASQKSLEEERRAHKLLQTKLDEESAKWEDERLKWEEYRLVSASRTSSPTPSQPQSQSARKTSGPLSATESFFLGFTRRSPARSPQPEPLNEGKRQRFPDTGFSTPPMRQDSGLSLPQLGLNMLRTSFPGPPVEEDDYFENTFSPSSTHRGPDIVSVSTVSAGPSVQLVERMAATVRRLEMEMAGSREDIAQMVAQRDEARREIVELTREVEVKKEAEERVKVLEKQVEEMERRMGTTLEMLGEKSEEAEELRADVADLKQMYRDLVSSTLK
ncbi:hypothetical protein RUND412_002946 [Rhizina undulata]